MWKNVARILGSLNTIPIEAIDDAFPLNGKLAKLQTGKTTQIASLGSSPEVQLQFLNVSRFHYAKHNDRGMKMGAKYLHKIFFERDPDAGDDAIVLRTNSLCGIRLIYDGVGVIAVHLKGQSGWEFGWQQDPDLELRQSTMRIRVSHAEWQVGQHGGSFVIASDVSGPSPETTFFRRTLLIWKLDGERFKDHSTVDLGESDMK